MFQHCQPMRNHHTEQLQGGNGKINSEKLSGQSSTIEVVSPYIISPCIYQAESPLRQHAAGCCAVECGLWMVVVISVIFVELRVGACSSLLGRESPITPQSSLMSSCRRPGHRTSAIFDQTSSPGIPYLEWMLESLLCSLNPSSFCHRQKSKVLGF